MVLILEGLKRRGYSKEQITAIRQAYKTLYKSGHTLEEAKQALDQEIASLEAQSVDSVKLFRDFLDTTTRGIVR